jgi:hypothetical protein
MRIMKNLTVLNMKQAIVLVLLAVSTYFHFRGSASSTSDDATTNPTRPHAIAAQTFTIVPAPSSYDRWTTGPSAQTDLKMGPTAQTDLKTGPNAQTDFEPFAPNEQATWNQTPSCAIVTGIRLRSR